MDLGDWAAGYRTDVQYTPGYFGEMNPLRLQLALLRAGIRPPQIRTACELGCGQGVSLAIHAAASDVQWWGVDVNPDHVCFARSLLAAAGSGGEVSDASFEQFATRQDLPRFDFIALHGVWSWISDANRAVLVDLIDRLLAPGGVVYLSYNTLHAWSAIAPLRQLLHEGLERSGSAGTDPRQRLAVTLDLLTRLLEISPQYAQANPLLTQRLQQMRSQNPAYLLHEYCNRHWQPMDFAEVHRWLSPARLSYATSANLLLGIEEIQTSADQQALLRQIADPVLRESSRDLAINQSFRRDYWVKGGQRLTPLEALEAFRALRVVLLPPPERVRLTVQGARGEATLQAGLYGAVVSALADHQPHPCGELLDRLQPQGINADQLMNAVTVLAGNGDLVLAQPAERVEAHRAPAQALNNHLLGLARSRADIEFLASPITGGGVMVGRIDQIFLGGLRAGVPEQAQALRDFSWALLTQQGQKLHQNGQQLETPEQNCALLEQLAGEFLTLRLPLLRQLQVVPGAAALRVPHP